MNVKTITVEYAATRSESYQSVRLGRAVEIELSEGDDGDALAAKVLARMVPNVNRDADDALAALLGQGQNGGR